MPTRLQLPVSLIADIRTRCRYPVPTLPEADDIILRDVAVVLPQLSDKVSLVLSAYYGIPGPAAASRAAVARTVRCSPKDVESWARTAVSEILLLLYIPTFPPGSWVSTSTLPCAQVRGCSSLEELVVREFRPGFRYKDRPLILLSEYHDHTERVFDVRPVPCMQSVVNFIALLESDELRVDTCLETLKADPTLDVVWNQLLRELTAVSSPSTKFQIIRELPGLSRDHALWVQFRHQARAALKYFVDVWDRKYMGHYEFGTVIDALASWLDEGEVSKLQARRQARYEEEQRPRFETHPLGTAERITALERRIAALERAIQTYCDQQGATPPTSLLDVLKGELDGR